MKLVSWNVNGVRSCWDKGLKQFIDDYRPDVLCLQETKATQAQLSEDILNPFKYHSYWFSAQKPGYSGVAIYSKNNPMNVKYGIGVDDIDSEGRVLTAEYSDFYLISAYFPNSQREHTRLPYKLHFCEHIHKYCNHLLKKKHIILCGDYNIAHQEIDLKNPKTNKDNAGFLPEERSWMTHFLSSGYVDGFRQFDQSGDNYTWWSYRPGVREKNIGWRIDYHCYNSDFKDKIKNAKILSTIKGSDHCPIALETK